MKKEDAIAAFEVLKEDVKKLEFGDDGALDLLKRRLRMVVKKVFGPESGYLGDLNFIQFSTMVVTPYTDVSNEIKAFEEDKTRALNLLQVMIDDRSITETTPLLRDISDFWVLIHPSIVKVAKNRFDSGDPGQRADSVESAFKEVNERVKEYVRKKIGEELDGVALMNRAFSPKNPVISVDDLSTETGKNRQKGYMKIFVGSMEAIRNPKAHSNIKLDENRAIHFLFVASLLMEILDEAGVSYVNIDGEIAIFIIKNHNPPGFSSSKMKLWADDTRIIEWIREAEKGDPKKGEWIAYLDYNEKTTWRVEYTSYDKSLTLRFYVFSDGSVGPGDKYTADWLWPLE